MVCPWLVAACVPVWGRKGSTGRAYQAGGAHVTGDVICTVARTSVGLAANTSHPVYQIPALPSLAVAFARYNYLFPLLSCLFCLSGYHVCFRPATMFSFRRKGSKKQDQGGPPYIRTSPSLPELSTQGVPWPEDLIDASEIPKIAVPPVPQHGASPSLAAVATRAHRARTRRRRLQAARRRADLCAVHRAAAAERVRQTQVDARAHAPEPEEEGADDVQRHGALPPRCVVSMSAHDPPCAPQVVGARGLGKTSLLRLLLETAEVSPTAPPEQRIALEHFLRGAPRPTREIHTTRIEICESRHDRLLLSVIDTPGLDFGDELTLERQVSSVVKHMEAQFADTLSEVRTHPVTRCANAMPTCLCCYQESKVVRKSKGDQHVHL